jgi:hypothetical protein
MAFAFRRFTASKQQEIIDTTASFIAKADALQTYGTIQSIKAVNPLSGEITEAIAFKDPSRGNSLVVKYAKNSVETSTSSVEAASGVSSGIISGLINTNYGDGGGGGGGGEPGPVFDTYVLYTYFDAKEACAFGDRGDGMSEPPQPIIVYVYKGEVFEDEKGQRLFNGRNLWFYVTDKGGGPSGVAWNIDMNGAVINQFICG